VDNLIKMQYLFIVLFIFTSCMSTKPTFDRVEYRYQDASVPPKYHRSYTIDIDATAKTIKADVDVYNKPLANATHPLSDADWKKLEDLASKIEAPSTKITKGATGTKTFIVRLHNAGKPTHELIWDSMNTVNADTEAFIEFVKTLVPNLDTLRQTEYKSE
jgi:hypothetical protein